MRRLRRVPRRGWLTGAVTTLLLALLTVTSATATQIRSGKLIVDADFGFAPRALPRAENVPVELFGGARLRMSDGTYPPVASFIEAEFERTGYVETRGLPICPPKRLEARTPPSARKACPDSIVGTGFGEGVVLFPEQGPIEASSPITFFNGPPIGGDPTVIAHAYLSIPAPTSILVRFRIKRLGSGYFGTRIEATVPRLAGGAGSITRFRVRLGRKWAYGGKQLSFVSAHCAHAGPHRFARGKVKFSDGTVLRGSIFTSCLIDD
jgi:hypothetical protein